MKHYETPGILIKNFQPQDVVRTSTVEDVYDWLNDALNADGTFKN